MTGETFGQWLKAQREALGMSLRDVERITEGRVSNASLSMIETGRTENPSIFTCIQLAGALGLTADMIWTRAAQGNAPAPEPPICPACGQFIRAGASQ